MLSANQIGGFLNEQFRLSKLMKQPHFWLGMLKNGYGQSAFWTVKLTISQE